MNIEDIEVPFSSVLLARRNTGKSVLAEYLTNRLLELGKIDVVYIFSKRACLNNNWESIPLKYKCEDMNFKKIEKIIKKQTITCKTKSKSKKLKNILLIFDDIIDRGGSNYELQNLFNDMFARGRHFKISIMLLNQYVKGIVSPTIRANIDFLFISSNTNEVLNYVYNIVIYKGKKDQFVDYVNEHTMDHQFIMYDNLTSDNTNRFYQIKADLEYNKSRIGKNKY